MEKLKFVLLRAAINKITPDSAPLSAPDLPGSFEKGDPLFSVQKRKSGNAFIDELVAADLPWYQLHDAPQLREMALRKEIVSSTPSNTKPKL